MCYRMFLWVLSLYKHLLIKNINNIYNLSQKQLIPNWGCKITGNEIADDLQKLKVNRMPNQKCRAAHENSQRIAITKHSKNLCAGGVEGNESHLKHMLRFVKKI